MMSSFNKINEKNYYKPQGYIGQNAASVSATRPQKTNLSLFYVNDMHGNIDNMSGMIAASDTFDKAVKEKNTDVIKLSGGDNFSGGNTTRNKLVLDFLSRMGIKASAVGNHEFDGTLSTLLKEITSNKTKFLAANAVVPEGSEFYNKIQKSTVETINGNQYGIIGLLPFDLESVTGNDDKKLEGVRVLDREKSIEAVNKEVQAMQEKGINKIILVSHIGNSEDRNIASKLKGVDIIIGGHSHTEVKGAVANENLFANADNEPILIVQTGENARNVGILNVEFDENGTLTTIENKLVKTTQEKSPVLSHIQNSVMGKSPKVAQISEIDPLPVNRRITPCAWTHLMCDAMRMETGVDIAFINAANTRKTPKAGIITELDIQESTPLKNTLLIKKMTEKEVVKGIKDALSSTFSNKEGTPGILHTSGLSYVANDKGELIELNFVDKEGNKTPIDINNPQDKVYSVCYDSFVEKGTEYPVFMPETMTYKEVDQRFEYDKDKLTISYIKKFKNNEDLKVTDDGRIKIIKTKETPSTEEPVSKEETSSSTAVPAKSPSLNDNFLYSPLLTNSINKMHSNAAISGYGVI